MRVVSNKRSLRFVVRSNQTNTNLRVAYKCIVPLPEEVLEGSFRASIAGRSGFASPLEERIRSSRATRPPSFLPCSSRFLFFLQNAEKPDGYQGISIPGFREDLHESSSHEHRTCEGSNIKSAVENVAMDQTTKGSLAFTRTQMILASREDIFQSLQNDLTAIFSFIKVKNHVHRAFQPAGLSWNHM